ncbi:hypothetical protein [Microtetraspora malaysiensis]|uniref:hypothetical protein n=1 Tax=Microtetraspora malaysiensis TaxID=161358 RepID=UPI003D8E1C96
MSVDVILPCLDEAEALPWVLGRLPQGFRAIVVDNGSADGSADIASSLGAVVVAEPRRGFGAACAPADFPHGSSPFRHGEFKVDYETRARFSHG